MRLKKHLASKLNKTYMLDGEFFYTPNIRKKTILLADLTIKQIGKPVLSVSKGDTPLERYFKKGSQVKK